MKLIIGIDSIVYFKDGYGNVLPPSPVNFTGQELYLTFEDANTIPGIVFLPHYFTFFSNLFFKKTYSN